MTTANNPVVLSEEEFETVVDVLEEEDGWLIGTDGVVDPDGNIVLLVSEDDAPNTSEAGHGLIEWLALTGVVATGVITVFRIFAPAFIAAFQTHIVNVLP